MLAALQFNLFPRHHQGLTGKIFVLHQIGKPHSVRFGVHIDILHKLLLSTMPGDLHQHAGRDTLKEKVGRKTAALQLCEKKKISRQDARTQKRQMIFFAALREKIISRQDAKGVCRLCTNIGHFHQFIPQ